MDQILREKQIHSLYHFTRAENLENIFRYGIMPRTDLECYGITSEYNDLYRYDDCLNAVCVSIEFPNYKMFYSLRMDNPGVEWAVLKLDASILYHLKCAFCWKNAADAEMYNIPIEDRMGREAFLELFSNREGYPKREDWHIPDRYPTNPQAEVLVFGTIPTKYIKCVCFENETLRQKYTTRIPECIPTRVNWDVFSYRADWQAWKNQD